TPPLCEGADLFYSDDFESGLGGWTLESNGVNQEWPDFNWVTVDNLPEDRAGFAAFAEDSRGGTCAPGGDISGAFSMDSAVITIPAGSVSSQVRFDHFVETELEYDGGNLMVSVNGGDFVVLTEDQFEFNAPKSNLSSTADGNTNPKAGELAWHGANGGEVTGSWGTTIVDLTELAGPGDTVQLRYDFGVDGCNGVTGWFVDNVNAYTCTDDGTVKPPAAPQQQPIADDAEPDQEGGVDQDGNYTVSWTYPDDAQLACGFRVEEATAFGNLFQDDANEALAAGANSTFSGDVEWRTAVHPTTGSNSYSPVYHDLSGATLTQIASVTLPAGQVAVLSFDSFEHIEEGFDQGIVSVSADGGALELVDIYTGEFSGRREVSLGAYAGQAVKIAFTLNSDFAFSAPLYEGWYIDNIEINSADWTTVGEVSGGVRSFDITERQDGTYHYRVIGMFGDCSGSPEDGPISNERSIVVERGVVLTLPPTASFTVTPSMAEVGEVVTFDGSGSYDNDSVGAEPQITSYFWSFGDGMTMTTSDPVTSHTYLAEGTYQVRLRVTDNDGQIDSADDFIVVDEVDDNSDSDSEKVKGSGYILIGEPADNDDDSDSDSDSDRKAKFSFNTKLKKGELKGSLKYEDKLNAVKVKADSISNRWVTGSDVTFTAPCEVNKVDGYSCTVYASDLDESGGVDTFAIHISEIDYQAGGELAKGDIKIY
ncbi:MAG: PKD domain-containing protein, partial [Woeseia sp.]|nr:PKD domain-containing protein [Woeseia sp.]